MSTVRLAVVVDDGDWVQGEKFRFADDGEFDLRHLDLTNHGIIIDGIVDGLRKLQENPEEEKDDESEPDQDNEDFDLSEDNHNRQHIKQYNHGWTCLACEEVFDDRDTFIEHFFADHGEKVTFECGHCETLYRREEEAQRCCRDSDTCSEQQKEA